MAHASEKKILVVDDELDVREFIAACLEDAGFQVETAEDGLDALNKIQVLIPDLITLDMVMPRKSGISFMRMLRRNREWQEIPVIVITARARDEVVSEDFKELIVAFEAKQRPRHIIEKPIIPTRLVETISEILSVQSEDEHASYTELDELINEIKKCDMKQLKEISNIIKQKS